MMLWATGCSHTYGSDLPDRSKAWPVVLGNKLGMEVINNGMKGGSNERIVYETLKQDKTDIKIIAWSYKERVTRYRTENNHQVNFQVNFTPNIIQHITDIEYTEYLKLHYAYWSNTLYNIKLWLQQIILIQSYFEQTNQRYYMFDAAYNQLEIFTSDNFHEDTKPYICFDLMTDEMIEEERQEIQKYISEIDATYYYGFNDFYMTSLKKDFATGETYHLLEDGHNNMAERMYDFICSS